MSEFYANDKMLDLKLLLTKLPTNDLKLGFSDDSDIDECFWKILNIQNFPKKVTE